MVQPLKIALALAIASALCRPAAAEGRVRFETDLSIERVSGFTTYQIGGDFTSGDGVSGTYRFPLSELEFPLNVFMTTVSAGLTIDEKFVVRAKYRHNNLFGAHKFNSFAGSMKDSDWGYWYLVSGGEAWADPDTLDIYSESDAYLTAAEARIGFLYRAVRKEAVTFGLGIGFLYQLFDYRVKNLDQWYPSYEDYAGRIDPDFSGHDRYGGSVIEYRVEYFIPAIETELGLAFGNLSLVFSLGFSPCACARDLDDHLLRYKTAEGESIGFAVLSSLDLKYAVHKNVAIGFTAGLVTVYARGEQVQNQYEDYNGVPEGEIGTVQNLIFTRQISAGMKLSLMF